MTGIDTMLREPAIQAVGWALLHFVWQGALVGIVAAAALRALRHSAADVRYVVAAIALSLMATMPVVTGIQAWRSATVTDATAVLRTPGSTAAPETPAAPEPLQTASSRTAPFVAGMSPEVGLERWLPLFV